MKASVGSPKQGKVDSFFFVFVVFFFSQFFLGANIILLSHVESRLDNGYPGLLGMLSQNYSLSAGSLSTRKKSFPRTKSETSLNDNKMSLP